MILARGSRKIETGPANTTPFLFTEQGADSQVFWYGGELIYKFYKKPYTTAFVRLYQTITNRASLFLEVSPYCIKGEFGGNAMDFRVLVNPILGVGETSQGVPVSVSKFIPGPDLYDLTYSGNREQIWENQRYIGKKIKDPDERRIFLEAMKNSYNKRKGVISLAEGVLEATCQDLESMIAAEGINLYPGNIKAKYNPKSSQSELVVTDLANGLYHYGIKDLAKL